MEVDGIQLKNLRLADASDEATFQGASSLPGLPSFLVGDISVDCLMCRESSVKKEGLLIIDFVDTDLGQQLMNFRVGIVIEEEDQEPLFRSLSIRMYSRETAIKLGEALCSGMKISLDYLLLLGFVSDHQQLLLQKAINVK